MLSYTAVSCNQGEALSKEYEFKQLTKKQKLKFISLGLSSFLYKQSFKKHPVDMNEQNDGVNETHQ
jgi:predicted GIY-YIG superfamily endonuclease